MEKSKVVRAARHHLWWILNQLNNLFKEEKLVCEFWYLDVLQRSNAMATVVCNASSKLARLSSLNGIFVTLFRIGLVFML